DGSQPTPRQADHCGAAFTRPAGEREHGLAGSTEVGADDREMHVDRAAACGGTIFKDRDVAALGGDAAPCLARMQVRIDRRRRDLARAGEGEERQEEHHDVNRPRARGYAFTFFVSVIVHKSRPSKCAVIFMLLCVSSMTHVKLMLP